MARAIEASNPSDTNVDTVPFVSEGIIAGVVGAGCVAAFLLVFDLIERQAFWTPFALGSGLFLGRVPADGAAIVPAIVAGYTLVHVSVFAGFGVLAAFLLAGRSMAGPGALLRYLAVAAALFVGFQACFLAYAVLAAPGLIDVFGLGRVAAANVLAAAAMAGMLTARSSPLRPEPAPPAE